MTVPFVTLPEARTYLNIRSGDTSYDEKIWLAAEAATAALETFTRRCFAKETHTVYFDTRDTLTMHRNLTGDGHPYTTTADRQRIPLKCAKLWYDDDNPISVWYDPYRVFGDDTIVAATNFIIDVPRKRMTLLVPTAEYTQSLKVTYTGGYTIDDTTDASHPNLSAVIPSDLKMACLYQLIYMFEKMESQTIGSSNNPEDGSSYENEGILVPEALQLASPFRRHLVGRL